MHYIYHIHHRQTPRVQVIHLAGCTSLKPDVKAVALTDYRLAHLFLSAVQVVVLNKPCSASLSADKQTALLKVMMISLERVSVSSSRGPSVQLHLCKLLLGQSHRSALMTLVKSSSSSSSSGLPLSLLIKPSPHLSRNTHMRLKIRVHSHLHMHLSCPCRSIKLSSYQQLTRLCRRQACPSPSGLTRLLRHMRMHQHVSHLNNRLQAQLCALHMGSSLWKQLACLPSRTKPSLQHLPACLSSRQCRPLQFCLLGKQLPHSRGTHLPHCLCSCQGVHWQ